MLQCSDIKNGYFILRNYIPKEKIALIKGTSLETFEFLTDDANLIRETLLAEAAQNKPNEAQSCWYRARGPRIQR